MLRHGHRKLWTSGRVDKAYQPVDPATGLGYVLPSAAKSVPSAYQAAVLLDNPFAYWRMEETAGATCLDASGNGLTATLGGSFYTRNVASATAKTGVGVSIGGGSSYGDLLANGILDITGDFTYECWANVSNLSVERTVMNKYYEGSEAPGTSITTAGKFRISRVSAGTTILLGSASLSTGTWYHLACTRAGNVWTTYIGGIQDNQTTVAVTCGNNTGRFRFGDVYNNSFPFAGTLDEIALYTHAVSQTNLAAHVAASV